MSLNNANRICKETTKQKLRTKATGRKHSEATKRKISEYNKGKRLSENVKQKISKTLKGKCTKWSVKSKVLCIETQEVFDSANACAAYFHLDAGLLGRRLDTGLAVFPKKITKSFV